MLWGRTGVVREGGRVRGRRPCARLWGRVHVPRPTVIAPPLTVAFSVTVAFAVARLAGYRAREFARSLAVYRALAFLRDVVKRDRWIGLTATDLVARAGTSRVRGRAGNDEWTQQRTGLIGKVHELKSKARVRGRTKTWVWCRLASIVEAVGPRRGRGRRIYRTMGGVG